MLERLYAALSRVPPAVLLASGVLSIFVLGLLDLATGPQIQLAIFFVVPVVVVGWFVGVRRGAAVAVLAVAVWNAADWSWHPPTATTAIVAWNIATELGLLLLVVALLARIRRQTRLLGEMAATDALTGLSNRRAFLDRAAEELVRAGRHEEPMTVAYLDADDLKRINDASGHDAGDAVLRRIGEVLKRRTRQVDVAARIGGDEFVVLFPRTELAGARRALDAVVDELSAGEPDSPPVSLSIGVVEFAVPPASLEQLLERADRRMYEAKRAGKRAIAAEVWTGPSPEEVSRRT